MDSDPIFSIYSLFGFINSVDMIPNKNEPTPNPHEMTPVTMPLLFGNRSQQILKGIVYPDPLQMPNEMA